MIIADFLYPTDAFVWSIGADPRLRSTIVTLVILDRAPAWRVVVDRFAKLVTTAPRFRCRISPSPWPMPPRWEDDPDFDLSFHVRRVNAPGPATPEILLQMARIDVMADFDQARPPWTVTLVDGFTDGSAALVCKLHHSLSDGVGAVALATQLFDGTPSSQKTMETDCFTDHLVDSVADIPGRAIKGLRHPLDALTTVGETGTSILRMVRPVRGPRSPIMLSRTKSRRLAVHQVSKEQLRSAGGVAGGTLNDAFLAALAGGLHRYHLDHQCPAREAALMMPINVRSTDDPSGGNRTTLMRLDVPLDLANPVQRIRAIHTATSRVRAEQSLSYTQAIAGVLNLTPRWYVDSVLRKVDFVASDVPGFPTRVSLDGAAVTEQYAFSPTIGAAFNATLLSYGSTCSIGVNADTGAIPDFEFFCECLVTGFTEVLALASKAT